MSFSPKIFLLPILSSLFLVTSKPVSAQEKQLPASIVYEQESLAKDIRQLKLQYRAELEEYRRSENLYLIAKDQYQKLATLASLEDAVIKTQAVMLVRDKVLLTYLRLLRLKLLSQAGIELSAKKTTEQNLLSAIKNIEQHQLQFSQTLDKPQLSQVAIDFVPLMDQLQEAAYQALTVLSIGKLQTIYDKSLLLQNEMKVEIATAGGALKSTERKRSFDEVDRALESLKPEFDFIESKYANPSKSGYKGVYLSIDKRLSSIHASLAKILTFLEELLKI